VNLVRLTGVKTITNAALRWIPPFLPTLEAAFGTSTRQMTTIIGAGEMAGLSTIGVGRHLDRGRERLVMTLSLLAISVSSLVMLIGTTFTFAVGFVLVILGVANCTVSGHAHISQRITYDRRARAIGLYETSWAFALLIGAPIVAALISVFGWRGPLVMFAILGLAGAVAVRTAPAEPNVENAARPVIASTALTPRAWAVVVGSAMLALSGLSVYAISGSWLDRAFGVETAELGAVAFGFGAVELVASGGSAGFADRFGKLRSTMAGIAALVTGLAVMAISGSALLVGVVGILVFLAGFEFAFVTSLSLVSEAMPSSRGKTLAVSNGIGTVARGSGTIASGWLFDAYGVRGTIVLSASAAVLAILAFVISRRVRA